MDKHTRILVADDHATSRRGLRALLATCPATEVIGEATNGREAVCQVGNSQPDVVLMDVRMPLLSGTEATRLIKDRWPGVKVIVLTLYATCEAEVRAAGADAFLVKGCPAEELLNAIQWEAGT